jgi:hypothetical protein
MMLNVLSYHFCRYLVAYCPHEVSVFPQFPSPQSPLHLWVLSEYCSLTQTLESTYHPRYRISRRKRTEYMNVIRTHFHLFYRDLILVGYLLKHLSNTLRNHAFQYLLAILWRPYQMICGVIGGVGCSSKNHARIVAKSRHLGIGHRALAKMLHPSPPRAAGHLEAFS